MKSTACGLLALVALLVAAPASAEIVSLTCVPAECGVVGVVQRPSCGDLGRPLAVSFDTQAHPDRLVQISEDEVIVIGRNPFDTTLAADTWVQKSTLQINRETGEFVLVSKVRPDVAPTTTYKKGQCTRAAVGKWLF